MGSIWWYFQYCVLFLFLFSLILGGTSGLRRFEGIPLVLTCRCLRVHGLTASAQNISCQATRSGSLSCGGFPRPKGGVDSPGQRWSGLWFRCGAGMIGSLGISGKLNKKQQETIKLNMHQDRPRHTCTCRAPCAFSFCAVVYLNGEEHHATQ